MKLRKGLTLIELLIVSIALSIISLGIFALYNQFYEIKAEVEAKGKLKNFEEIVYQSLFSIDKVKAMLASNPYDKTTKTFDLNSSLYYLDDNNVAQEIFKSNTLHRLDISYTKMIPNNKTIALSNFLNIQFGNDIVFYKNIFYFITTEKEILFGYIPITYKKFTFIHINDAKFSNYLNNTIKNGTPSNTSLILSKFFDTSKNFLIVKNNDLINDPDITIGYVKDNWRKIRKKINMIQFTTREQIVEPLKYLTNQISEAQKKINDWATIQSRYEAHKSISTGNTLNVDYFISCIANITNNTCKNDTNIPSTQTLIKLDNASTSATESSVKFIDLISKYPNVQNQAANASTNYGFLIFSSNNTGVIGIKDSTNGCNNSFTDNKIDIIFSLTNSAKISLDNPITSNCETTQSIASMVNDFNPFGYPIYFTNSNNPDFTINTPNITINNLNIVKNRYPNGVTTSPYNANIFTFLPNGVVLSKKLYGHIF